MDMMDEGEKEPSIYLVTLYAILSIVCIVLFALLMFVACSRRYKLNWFEKNLLETASDSKELAHSQEALVQESIPGSSRNLSSPGEEKFWVPHNLHRSNSFGSDDNASSTPEDSVPASPTSSSSYQPSVGPIPIARNDKQIVLTNSSPVRPKMSSMQSKLDHTKIDTSLYQQESPGEPENVRGSLHVTLTYDPIAGILTVRLIEAQDLQARDFSGTADPYAKIRLLPDLTNVWQTRIHKKTLNPVFDEDFVFEVRPATLGRHTVDILLYDFDAYSRHHNIGGVQIALTNVDLSEKVDMWRSLESSISYDPRLDLGELMVSIAYLPSAGRLTVVIIKARNLRVVDDTRNSSDPYVKVYLISDTGRRLKKRKTGVQRGTVNPVFNEALAFDIGKGTLKKCTLHFLVLHDSLLGASEPLGRCLVGGGTDCRLQEKEFFQEALHSKTASARWLPLSDPRAYK